MATYRSADEVEQEHVAVLGPELGFLYHRLYNECVWLQLTWAQYVELFGSKPERVDLLNRAAGFFFRMVQDTLWDDTLLQLARLTDPPQSAGKANLTIQRLPPLLADTETRPVVQALVDAAITATGFARDWRNRHIAHRDLALSLERGAQPLALASRKLVNEAIRAVCGVIQQIHLVYFDSELRLDIVPAEPMGAVSLLYVIRDGLEADKSRRQRLRDGEPTPEDLRPPGAV